MRLSIITLYAIIFILPVLAGLFATIYAAFIVTDVNMVSLDHWQTLFAIPGVWTSLELTLVTGLSASILSLLFASAFCICMDGYADSKFVARTLTQFLAVPHAALAIGLAFIIAPSGWLVRLIAPLWGIERPPDFALVNDPFGLALIIGLVIKETPFLILMILSARSQIPVGRDIKSARSLGYPPQLAWIKFIWPQLWPLIRLPFMVVMAYSLSTVEMGLILGPSNPPVFSVLLMRLFFAPDLALLHPAAAGAILQILLIVGAFVMLMICESFIRRIGLWWIRRGGRQNLLNIPTHLFAWMMAALFIIGFLSLMSLFIWSFAWRWPWPDVLPESWSVRHWVTGTDTRRRALGATLILAFGSTVLSLVFAVLWLETEKYSRAMRKPFVEVLIYVPLLLPQIGFLYGINTSFLKTGLGGGYFSTIWVHAIFVFPYVMIALAPAWRAFDPIYTYAAASLGAAPLWTLMRVKLPLLSVPLIMAAAVGISVSVAQYLPTLFMGAGRISTLTTEAVALSSGSDRRVLSVYASLQALLPFLAYLTAFLVSRRHSRVMSNGMVS